MVSPGAVVTAIAVLALAAINTVATAIAIRFFRIRLATRWATALYTVLLVPLLYVLTTLVVFGALGIGGSASVSREALLLFVWGFPFAVGASVELFWMPPPDEYDE